MSSTDYIYHITGAIVAVAILQIVVTKVELSKEAKRRIQHAATGQLLIIISYLLPLSVCQIALFAGISLLLYVYHCHEAWYKNTFGPLLRPSEQDSLPGAFWFLVGTWISAMCFDMTIGRYAILCLSYADPMAAWVGSSIPSPQVLGNATMAGCCACFCTSIVIGWFILSEDAAEIGVGALVCTLAECLPIGNDNLLIPVVTAAAVQLLRTYR